MISSKLLAACSLFVLLGCAPLKKQAYEVKFNAGEHLILGDEGFKKVCANKKLGICNNKLQRPDGASFSYGELVAFSGDFYQEPEHLYGEKDGVIDGLHHEILKPFLYNATDKTKALFYSEVKTIENFLHGHVDAPFPDFNIKYAYNYPEYLALAAENITHFGFYNLKNYVKYHSEALAFAVKASEGNDNKLLILALYYNAFADHFLTDGFASGHIRTPRSQIAKWSERASVDKITAGLLAKIVHDRDGEVREAGGHGLDVTNSNGDNWFARCDAQLFWNNSMESEAVILPIRAVEASVHEIIEAYETGKTPEGIYAATTLVPFPSKKAPALESIFRSNMSDEDLDKIIASTAFYEKLNLFFKGGKATFRSFLQNFSGIMAQFRKDVSDEIANNPDLKKRLPVAYLDAYSSIQ